MKVDFMIIGAQKCATTTLFDILRSHPDLCPCSNKEPHYFSTSEDWRAGLDDYHALYPEPEGKLCYEGSTTYTFAPHRKAELWEDLYAYNPDLKFIYMVRNPLQRIVSAYMHAYERGYTKTDLETAIRDEAYFTDVSRYAKQIQPYIDRFGADQVLLIAFDDFNANRAGSLKRVFEFLGIDEMDMSGLDAARSNRSIGGNKAHKRFDKPKAWHSILERRLPWLWNIITDNSARGFKEKPFLSLATQSRLLEELEPDIQAMESYLGQDLSAWRQPIKQP